MTNYRARFISVERVHSFTRLLEMGASQPRMHIGNIFAGKGTNMVEDRRNRKTFAHIGTVVENVLKQYRPQRDQDLIQVWEVWEQAVGKALADNAKPAAVKGAVLLVHVSSSTWLHHMRFLEAEMIEKINKALEGPKVKSIKFKVGSV